MTHSGQGDEPQHPAARPAQEGVVLPGDGSEPWIPGSAPEQAAPSGGQPWGQQWSPQQAPREQPDQEPGHGYGGPSYGGQYPQHGQPLSQGQSLPLPAEAPSPGSSDATQYLPPVPAAGPGDATQFIAPVPQGPGPGPFPGEQAAEATQFLPPVPGPDAEPTQFIPPVPAQDFQNAPYAMRPGTEAERQPPAEFDNLFRTGGGGGQDAGSTQQLPQFDESRAPLPYAPQPPVSGEPQRASYDPRGTDPQDQGRGARRRSSPLPIIAAVVVGCAVIGLGAGWLMSGDGDQQGAGTAGSSASAPAGQPSGQAAADPAKQQAQALDKLLADSSDSRAAVGRAVENIKSCDSLGQAADDLHDAAEKRRALVTRLKGLALDKLPGHADLGSSLTKAWQASAAADDHYADWAGEAGEGKNCKGGHARRTRSAERGDRSSGDATEAKQQASVLWNKIAATYGLPERERSQF